MSDFLVNRIYRKKHFYKVTWTRSEQLLKETPWLKPAQHEFCMIGYHHPSFREAEEFIGSKMYDRLFDRVIGVEEISRDAALKDFQMDDWRSQKVFGTSGKRDRKPSLSAQILAAANKGPHAFTEYENGLCKVTFCRTSGIADGHIFDVYLDYMPSDYKEGRDDFLYDPEDRQRAYDLAAEQIGEDALSDYVILSAKVLRNHSKDMTSIPQQTEPIR